MAENPRIQNREGAPSLSFTEVLHVWCKVALLSFAAPARSPKWSASWWSKALGQQKTAFGTC